MEMHTDVLIVGAGPTGLALATTLRRAGVAPLVVERLQSGQNTSRAAVIHAHTLDVLDRIGVARALTERGLRLNTFSIRDRDRTLVRLRFDDLPSPHAYLLMLPQDQTERILADGLVDAGGAVQWGCEVTSFTRTPNGVRAEARTAAGPVTIHARYVVGADGMRSLVREAANIGFSGATYEESFVLADVKMEWGPGHDEVMIFFSPAGLLVVAPLPGERRYRIVATLSNAPELPAIPDLQAILDVRGPVTDGGTITDILWYSRFRIHHRVADRYRQGPFLLMGDAAHVHSPAGGQGMNTGLVDAFVLGRLLADVITGGKDEAWLDRYEQQRRPAAMSVLQLANRLTRMAVMQGAMKRGLRNALLRLVQLNPVARWRLKMSLSGLSRRAAAQVP
jgi:2-polyprenyl-6-methoxyphenol hydroxylase-like FAD-dependent oxidoreductase